MTSNETAKPIGDMIMKKTSACVACVFAVCAFASLASSAKAVSLPAAVMNTPVDESLFQTVALRNCTRDDRGWRYMRGERRVTCRPSRPSGLYWGWRSEGGRSGWWHRRENRWND